MNTHLHHAQRDGRVVGIPGLIQLVVEHGQHLPSRVHVVPVLGQTYGQWDDARDDGCHQVVGELCHAHGVGRDGQLVGHGPVFFVQITMIFTFASSNSKDSPQDIWITDPARGCVARHLCAHSIFSDYCAYTYV